MRQFLFLICIAFLFACESQKKHDSAGLRKRSYEIKASDTSLLYFPVSLLADTIEKMQNPDDTSFINSFPDSIDGYISYSLNEWYSRFLKAMGEPILKNSRIEVVRFTWLRTFHKPIVISIGKNEEATILRAVVMSGAGGYEPGEIEAEKKLSLAVSSYDSISKRIEDIGFWSMESQDTSRGTDGSEWIIEASNSHQYHFVSRWTPDSGPIKDLGLWLLQIGGIKQNDVY